ncbi:unnamed protein product [Ectocarpus sp. 4 AP-2014]
MARGALKGLKRTRPSAGEKLVVKGQLAQGGAGRSPGQNTIGSQGGASSPNAGAELDNAELVSWLNCECFFSLVLVGLLAALPFNLHTQELMQTPETYVARALELSEDGAFDKVPRARCGIVSVVLPGFSFCCHNRGQAVLLQSKRLANHRQTIG